MADNKIQVDFELNDKGVKKGLDNLVSTSTKALTPLVAIGAAATAAGVAIAGIITKKSIDAASDYEDVVNRLNVALASSGQFSKDAADSFRDFAGAMQSTTKFSDDQVLSSAALIQNLGRLSNEGLQQATKATLDLASALNIDLQAASLLVGKAANGNIDSFTRYGVSIQKGKTDTETFANTLKTLELRFGGAAEAASNTFAGSLAKLKNSFDDIFKEIGRGFTKSPALIAGIKFISDQFQGLATSIRNSIGSKDIFKDIIINFSVIAQTVAEVGRQIGVSFELGFLRAKQAWLGFKVLVTAGLSETFNKQLMEVNQQIDDTKNSFSDTSSITQFFDGLIEKVSETGGTLNSFTDGIKNIPQEFQTATITSSEVLNAFTEQFKMQQISFKEGTEGYAQASQAAKDKIVSDFQQIGLAARNGIGQAAGQGFAAFGKALVSGENALKAFANAFIGAIGGTMISEGTGMILRGIGYSLDPFLAGFGPPLIQAGAALATFGGALQALSGGGGGGAAGGGVAAGGGGAGSLSSPETTEFNEELAPERPAITVNVQGNVLDRRETGLELVSIINEAFDTQGFATV